MAKRVVWTVTAKKARNEIPEYWIARNKPKVYSKKLSALLKEKVELLKSEHYLGKPTGFKDIRVTLVGHFSIFSKVLSNQIIIVEIWDKRRNPRDLHDNLEL